MSPIDEAQKIVEYIDSLPDLRWVGQSDCAYSHMGALLTDAGLQAGLNYRHVVAPRVNRILLLWPDAITTARFAELIDQHGLNEVLDWNDQEKPRRIYELAQLLVSEDVDSVQELSSWISMPCAGEILQSIRGVGPKTVDYLRKLAGVPAIAIDRHLTTFALSAGVGLSGYEELSNVYESAARILGVDCSVLDATIWHYIASPSDLPEVDDQLSISFEDCACA